MSYDCSDFLQAMSGEFPDAPESENLEEWAEAVFDEIDDLRDSFSDIFGALSDAGLLPQGAEDMPLEQQAPAMLDAVRKLIEAKDVLTLIATQPREGSVPQQVVRMQRIARALLTKLGEAKP